MINVFINMYSSAPQSCSVIVMLVLDLGFSVYNSTKQSFSNKYIKKRITKTITLKFFANAHYPPHPRFTLQMTAGLPPGMPKY